MHPGKKTKQIRWAMSSVEGGWPIEQALKSGVQIRMDGVSLYLGPPARHLLPDVDDFLFSHALS